MKEDARDKARGIIAEKTALAWLKYAEHSLKEDVIPTPLSGNPEQWVQDTVSMMPPVETKAAHLGPQVLTAIGKEAISIAVRFLYEQPLTYPRTLHFIRTRAFINTFKPN